MTIYTKVISYMNDERDDGSNFTVTDDDIMLYENEIIISVNEYYDEKMRNNSLIDSYEERIRYKLKIPFMVCALSENENEDDEDEFEELYIKQYCEAQDEIRKTIDSEIENILKEKLLKVMKSKGYDDENKEKMTFEYFSSQKIYTRHYESINAE